MKKNRLAGEFRKQTLFNLFTNLIFVTKCEPHIFLSIKVVQCNEGWLRRNIKYQCASSMLLRKCGNFCFKGAFTKYFDKIFPIIDHLPVMSSSRAGSSWRIFSSARLVTFFTSARNWKLTEKQAVISILSWRPIFYYFL